MQHRPALPQAVNHEPELGQDGGQQQAINETEAADTDMTQPALQAQQTGGTAKCRIVYQGAPLPAACTGARLTFGRPAAAEAAEADGASPAQITDAQMASALGSSKGGQKQPQQPQMHGSAAAGGSGGKGSKAVRPPPTSYGTLREMKRAKNK